MTVKQETLNLLKKRSSIRKFKDKAIPEAIVQDLLECGVRGASAGNLQPFSIIRLSSDSDKEFLTKDASMQGFVAHAAENFLFCMDFNRLKKWAELSKAPFSANHSYNHFWVIFEDVIICAQNMALAADAYELGSCYIGTTVECAEKLIDYCKLPYGVFPIVLLSVGYPDQAITPSTKLTVKDILHESYYHDYRDEEVKAMYDKKYANCDRPLNQRMKDNIVKVAQKVNGEAYANECLAEMERTNVVNYAQYRFGLHYCADEMLEGRDEFVALLKKQGIDWIL
ncbi:MAG: nitroreductase family protein [Erysipelotrichaceae bacterium]